MKRAIVLLVLVLSTVAFAADNAERVAQLEAENAELKAQIAELQSQIEALKQQVNGADEVAAGDGENAAGDKDGGKPAPAGKNEWIITIVANDPVDERTITTQLDAARLSLADIDKRLTAARNRHDEMGATYTYDYDSRKRERKFTDAEMSRARSDIQKIENEQRQTNGKIARLERELREAKYVRHVSGQTDDGKVVKLVITNPAMGQFASTMKVGSKYKVMGLGTFSGGAINVKMTAATEVSGTAQAGS